MVKVRDRVQHISLFAFALLVCNLFLGSTLGLGLARADECAKLNKTVIRLRADYRDAASRAAQADSNVGFEELTGILDKIVDARRRMRNLGCREGKATPKNNY